MPEYDPAELARRLGISPRQLVPAECDPAEKARYEIVRQRLLVLKKKHPELLNVSIAVLGRKCPACHRKRVVEHPADQFRCGLCGYTWEVIPAPARVSHRGFT